MTIKICVNCRRNPTVADYFEPMCQECIDELTISNARIDKHMIQYDL